MGYDLEQAFADGLTHSPVKIRLDQLWYFVDNQKFALSDFEIEGALPSAIDAEIIRILRTFNLRYENWVELVKHFIRKPGFSRSDLKILGDWIGCSYTDLENIGRRESWFQDN